jgi:prepilin-type N-terminal cleavage/methylation domain-containing protein
VIRRLRCGPRDERGFTLVELLVTMVVLGVLAGAFAVLFSSVATHSTTISDQMTLQVEARAALDRFASDLRQTYSGDTATNSIESIAGGGTAIQFLTPDRAVPFHLRRVAYRVAGGRFERAEAISADTDGAPWSIPALSAWATLVPNVITTAPFTFRDASGATTTNPALVREVLVQLTVRTPTGRTTTHSESVTVRAGQRS